MSWRTRTRRLLPYLIVAAAGFLAAYLVVFFFVFPTSALVPNDATVPNVVGLTVKDATGRLAAAGLKLSEGERRTHATAPEGAVLSQDPLPGSSETGGATVRIVASAGQKMAEVPAVVGLSQQAAQVAIENAGFDLGDIALARADAPRGQVIMSSPVAGSRVALPQAIALTVSNGPSTVAMPELIGRSLADARATLEQLGLTVGQTTTEASAFDPPGTVTGQSPVAGRAVPGGMAVRLTIAGDAPPAGNAPPPPFER